MTSENLPFQYDIGRRSPYVGRGQETQVEHFKAYVCQPPIDTDKAVIVVHDIYGWQFPDTRYIADLVAETGYMYQKLMVPAVRKEGGNQTWIHVWHLTAVAHRAICPDFFLGKEPWKPTNHWKNFADWLKHRDPMKVDRTADTVVKYLREHYNAQKIGIIGFSWGGMAVHHLMLTNPELKAGVSLYGIIRDSEERYNLLSPTFFIFGGRDHTISLDQVTLLEEKLKEYCKMPFRIKVYPEQVHGFVQTKPADMKPDNVLYIEEAQMDMMDWLNKYLMF